MSSDPEFSLQSLAKPWPKNNPAAAIKSSDLILIALGISAWIVLLSFAFDGGANASNNWASQPDDAFARNVRFGTLMSFAGFSLALISLWALARMRRYTPAMLSLKTAPIPAYILLIPAWFVSAQIIGLLYSLVSGQSGLDTLSTIHQEYQAAYRADFISQFAYWSVVAVLRPLAMAVVFRGWVFGWLRMRMGFWPSAFISSALYAASYVGTYDHILEVSTHYVASVQAVDLIIKGLVACLLTEFSRSIWPSALLAIATTMISLAFS